MDSHYIISLVRAGNAVFEFVRFEWIMAMHVDGRSITLVPSTTSSQVVDTIPSYPVVGSERKKKNGENWPTIYMPTTHLQHTHTPHLTSPPPLQPNPSKPSTPHTPT